MFTGEYRHSVDSKGRLAVPSKFRAQLSGGAVVTVWLDTCLAIWTKDDFAAFMGRVRNLPIVGDADARAFARWVAASAAEVEFDAQGRFVIPGHLREKAGLGANVVIAGSWDKAEVWDAARYDGYRGQIDPEALASKLSGLGI